MTTVNDFATEEDYWAWREDLVILGNAITRNGPNGVERVPPQEWDAWIEGRAKAMEAVK